MQQRSDVVAVQSKWSWAIYWPYEADAVLVLHFWYLLRDQTGASQIASRSGNHSGRTKLEAAGWLDVAHRRCLREDILP